MAKTRSWSVKGIDGETRDLAREAAQSSGMTIGAWIDQAILKAKHGELSGIPPAAITASPKTAQPELVQQDLPLLSAQPEHPPEPLTVNPQEQPVAETPSAVPVESPAESPTVSPLESTPEPSDEFLPEPVGAAPATVDAAPTETRSMADDIVDGREIVADAFVAGQPLSGDPSSGPQPLAPLPARPSVMRYALAGIFFAALLGVGGWLLIDLSSPDRAPTPRKIADAAAEVETPPPPPAASSTTTTPVAPTPQGTPATAPGTDGLPAGLPDAIRTVISQARAGDPKAQYDLGMLHLSGRLGDKNPTEAAKWFERAAEQGAANAQFNLGVLYLRGEGVAQNDKLAFFWYQSAAEQNFPQAQHNLATAYAEGKGIARSYPKAAEWFTRSAEAGLGQSQYSLGALHERGLITGQPNAVEARRWYERALAQGDTRASVRLAVLDAPRLPVETSPAVRMVTAPVTVPPSSSAIGRAEIRQIQTLLNGMKFNPGPADGQMGRRTADAIRLYQKFAGMDEDGAPSRELLEDLRAVANTMPKDG